jgi:hypothetical protein
MKRVPPPEVKPLPTVDEMVKELKKVKAETTRKFNRQESRPTRHDMTMVAVASKEAMTDTARMFRGYAISYLGVRFGFKRLIGSEIGRRWLSEVTPQDIEVMQHIYDRMPAEKADASYAIVDALREKILAGEKTPPLSTFQGILDKAQLGSLLRLMAPPQQAAKPAVQTQP